MFPSNIIAPPKFDCPFRNVILFKITLLEVAMLNIADCFKAFIVKPLPLIVIGFVMLIPVLEKVFSYV